MKKISNGLRNSIIKFCKEYLDYKNNKLEKELLNAAYKRIDDFYEDYSERKYYIPENSLYDFVKVDLKHWKVSTDPKNMTEIYHQMDDVRRMGDADPDYIYTMTFERGYHGGFEREHKYYWRRPKSKRPLRFYHHTVGYGGWKKEAKKSTPIDELIEKDWNDIIDNMYKKYNTQLLKLINRAKKELM